MATEFCVVFLTDLLFECSAPRPRMETGRWCYRVLRWSLCWCGDMTTRCEALGEKKQNGDALRSRADDHHILIGAHLAPPPPPSVPSAVRFPAPNSRPAVQPTSLRDGFFWIPRFETTLDATLSPVGAGQPRLENWETLRLADVGSAELRRGQRRPALRTALSAEIIHGQPFRRWRGGAATCAASGRGEPSTAAAVANSDPSPRTSGGAHLVFHSRPNYRVVPRFSSSGAQAGLWWSSSMCGAVSSSCWPWAGLSRQPSLNWNWQVVI